MSEMRLKFMNDLEGIIIDPYSSSDLMYKKNEAIELLNRLKKNLYIVSETYAYILEKGNITFGGCRVCKRNEKESWIDYVNRSNKVAIDYIEEVQSLNNNRIVVYGFSTITDTLK